MCDVLKYMQVKHMNSIVNQISFILFDGMIIITLGMIVYALLHLRTLSTSLSKMNASIDQTKKKMQLMNIKMEVLQEEQARKAKQNRIAGLIIPGLIAIKAVYDAHDNYHGFSGYRKAANDVLFGSKTEAFRKKMQER